MNYFFAISLAGSASRIQRDLLKPLGSADTAQQVRWSLPENLHITLAYIGILDADSLKRTIAAAEQLAIPAFTVGLKDIAHFPDAKSRILALDVSLNDSLRQLKLSLDAKLTAVGISYDAREYRPHVTLGRIKHRQQIDGWQLPSYSAKLRVKEFVLYGSSPSQLGGGLRMATAPASSVVPPSMAASTYTAIARFPLKS